MYFFLSCLGFRPRKLERTNMPLVIGLVRAHRLYPEVLKGLSKVSLCGCQLSKNTLYLSDKKHPNTLLSAIFFLQGNQQCSIFPIISSLSRPPRHLPFFAQSVGEDVLLLAVWGDQPFSRKILRGDLDKKSIKNPWTSIESSKIPLSPISSQTLQKL